MVLFNFLLVRQWEVPTFSQNISLKEKVLVLLEFKYAYSAAVLCISHKTMRNHYHHHHVALPAQISLTLSRHPSLLPIDSCRSSRLHPWSAQNWSSYLCSSIWNYGIYEFIPTSPAAFCLDVAQGHMKEAPNETRTHSCRFASRAC